VVKSVTYVAGLKCYLCPWTKPPQASSRKPQAASRKPQASSRKPPIAVVSGFSRTVGCGGHRYDNVERVISDHGFA